ncbi:MAG TPA: serine/threonine-protein kinase [Chitinivibrionales bacterium]|nr:serine/threonine-protein kinase [Chitinivibrionales bacterium]
MATEQIIVRPDDTKRIELPGTVSLPDGKKPIKLGSGVISSLISAGGMAIVYEIWNPVLEVKRAVKLLKPDHTRESEDRFRTEMKITAKLHHPNIVEIYSVGTWNDLPYIEMELIDGVTLETLIGESGGLPPEVVTSLGIMVGRALNYAHNQSYVLYGKHFKGVIHRDLKPSNIMVAKDGVAKLMDFGIAKPMDASIHTVDGTVMGTMQYLAPEQLDVQEVDVRADLYSLGTVLYEALTGRRAFPEEKLGKLVTDKLSNNYIPLSNVSAKIPAALSGLIQHCIRNEKEKRVQNSLEFLRSVCRIHKTLTLRAPEQILQQFLEKRGKVKHIVNFHDKRNIAPFVIGATIGAVVLAAAFFAGLYVLNPSLAVRLLPRSVATALYPGEPSAPPPPHAVAPSAAGNTDSLAAQPQSLPVEAPAKTEENIKDLDEIFTAGGAAAKPVKTKRGAKHIGEVKQPAQATPVPAPVPAPQPVADQTAGLTGPTLLDKLKQLYRTSDVMTIFSQEVEAGRFTNALELYKMLAPEQAGSKKSKLYKLRALKGTGDNAAVKSFVAANTIDDGEFYLEKARWSYVAKDFVQAYDLIKRASVTPAAFMDGRAFRELLLYSKALCASALYDRSPSDDARKEAMEAWYDVKTLFKTSPEHRYYLKADAEIRRISTSVAAK